jgi:rhodanese-related sulfurtransferase
MKVLNIKDYHKSMGILIDVRNPLEYKQNHHPDAINIYYEKLMYSPQKYLDHNKVYYIMCHKGVLSEKTVKYLEFLKYNVIKIIN